MSKAFELGKYGEKYAAQFLKKNGYSILEKNKHQSHNEIDIIAFDKTYIVFAEVKTRSVQKDLYSPYGSPAAAVNKAKQERTIRAAQEYIAHSSQAQKLQPRMDVIEIYVDKEDGSILKVNHIINAYGVR